MVSDITDLLVAVWSRFLSISLLVYFLSAQSGQEVYCEDWLQLYLRWCFSPILFSVNAVFRLSAGNYCLPRLQPNIHSGSLCLSLLIWRTKLFLGASEGFSNGCTFEIQSEQLLSSQWDWRSTAWLKKIFNDSVLDVRHRMMNHTVRFMP